MTTELNLEKILEKFTLLKNRAEQDCLFNKEDFSANFSNSDKIYHYIQEKTDWIKIHSYFEIKYKKLLKKLYEHYKLEFDLNLTSEERKVYIESDDNYIKINQELTYIKEIINFIDGVIDTLRRKSYEMKLYLDWQNFKNGVK